MRTLLVLLAVVGLAAIAAALLYDGRGRPPPADAVRGPIAVGVLGDSDSGAYQNHAGFGARSELPGGAFHDITFQWPEVLARLRGEQVDLGRWGTWGVPRWLSMSRVRALWGQRWRSPYKQDYRHNFAKASGCADLLDVPWAQAPQLRYLMDEEPARWRNGVVVIRIGVNDFGKLSTLSRLAQSADDAEVGQLMAGCVRAIEATLRFLRERHPQLRFVLVGIFDNAHWTPYLERWQSAREVANIGAGLDRFDQALRRIADADERIAFFDDRAWFDRLWGGRDAQGRPAYRTVRVGDRLEVRNEAGDRPDHAVLANLHAGLVWNVLWVQSLVDLMRRDLGLAVPAVTDDEVRGFVEGLLRRVE